MANYGHYNYGKTYYSRYYNSASSASSTSSTSSTSSAASTSFAGSTGSTGSTTSTGSLMSLIDEIVSSFEDVMQSFEDFQKRNHFSLSKNGITFFGQSSGGAWSVKVGQVNGAYQKVKGMYDPTVHLPSVKFHGITFKLTF